MSERELFKLNYRTNWVFILNVKTFLTQMFVLMENKKNILQ